MIRKLIRRVKLLLVFIGTGFSTLVMVVAVMLLSFTVGSKSFLETH